MTGGGLFIEGVVDGTYVTIAGNETEGVAGPGTVVLAGSIVADQVAGPDCAVPLTTLGWNLSSDVSCGFTAPSDLAGVGAGLAALAFIDATFVHLPLAGSPAIDSIPAGTPTLCDGTIAVDQLGDPRPTGTACTRGATERIG